MRITEKGQITIPQLIRLRYGFMPQTEVVFLEEGGRVFIEKTTDGQSRGKKIVEALRGSATVKMSTDEIMALTRGGVQDVSIKKRNK